MNFVLAIHNYNNSSVKRAANPARGEMAVVPELLSQLEVGLGYQKINTNDKERILTGC
jgi:hypothetical protein